MTDLLHELLERTASRTPHSTALVYRDDTCRYDELQRRVGAAANGFLRLGVARQQRIGIYLPKRIETVTAFFAASRAGAVFVPINPLLKPAQVEHIMRDCTIRVLISTTDRLQILADVLTNCPDLGTVVTLDELLPSGMPGTCRVMNWRELAASDERDQPGHRVIDADMAAILYTSGSTGKPKGVVLSHRNMVTGALSVASYLQNRAEDRLLVVLPFSFDYGFSQLSTAFSVGASAILMDYLLPRDVIAAAARYGATGLAGVPPLWSQLAALPWPDEARRSLRYLTNSGGAMPRATLQRMQKALPDTQVFLMYGLTEAFRSTFLPPAEIERRPDSIGKAIPNAEILVVRPDGTPCAPEEPGELVHRGSLVALGYWNDPAKTAERFKPVPGRDPGLVLEEFAVWSGDTVRMDEEGYLYFIGRRDETIKTSGYRVSPTEVEEVVYASGVVADAAAIGVPHPTLGHAIVVVASPAHSTSDNTETVLNECRRCLPAYMVPARIEWREALPRNPNGKLDRVTLARELAGLFASDQ